MMNIFISRFFGIAGFFLFFSFYANTSFAAGRVLTPEQFGCSGQGPAKPDTVCFSEMLSSLKDGDIINLKSGANYYNSLPFGKKSVWSIRKSVTLNGNGARLSKRRTIFSRVTDDDQTAVLEIGNTNNVSIKNIDVSGDEARGNIVNKENSIISTNTYGVSKKINYGILILNSKDVVLENVKVQDALFGVWVKSSSNFSFDGQVSYSGQLIPVKGDDLQLGAGIKLSDVNGFKLNVKGTNNTNALVEAEPNDVNGVIACIADNSFSSGLTINSSQNIVVNAVLRNGERAGAQLVEGVRNISGSITSVSNARYGVLISNFSKKTGGVISKINLAVISKKNGNYGLYIANRSGNRLDSYNIKYTGFENNVVNKGEDIVLRGIGGGKIYGISSGSTEGVRLSGSGKVDLSGLNLNEYGREFRIKKD